MRNRTELRGPGGDDGFTLVELIIAIIIIGVITVPLGDVVIGFLRSSDATTARLLESHDVQIASAYWARDVTSIGMRIGPGESGFETTPFALKPSVAVGTDASLSSLPPCGTTGTPIVRFAWDDFSESGVKSIVQVAYVLETPTELHRIRCNSAGDSDITLTHDLVTPPALACPQPGEPTPPPTPTPTCTPSPVPKTFLLYLSVKDQGNSGDPYSVMLAGQRRES
jgi:prepilin-type N-terminal cleavage/methylation domain-containing protein